jgi:nucleotide-binding universal stress UspA family protein
MRDDTETLDPILAAYSPSTAAREPVEFGLAASRLTGAPLVVVAVRPGGPLVNRMAGDVDEGDGRAAKHLRLDLERRGVDAEIREYVDNTAGTGLERAMEELHPELVVVGTTHRGRTGSALLGTTAERVIHVSRCPVAVVPHGYQRPEHGVRLIGAAYTPTPEGREALHAAAALARIGNATVRAIRVLDPKHAEMQSHGMMAQQHHDAAPEEGIEARERLTAEGELADAVAELSGDVPTELDTLYNDPADGVLAAAGQLDLLVMGSRAYGPRRAVLLGSVSRKVAERAPCPVLVVPRGASAATEALLAHAASHRP